MQQLSNDKRTVNIPKEKVSIIFNRGAKNLKRLYDTALEETNVSAYNMAEDIMSAEPYSGAYFFPDMGVKDKMDEILFSAESKIPAMVKAIEEELHAQIGYDVQISHEIVTNEKGERTLELITYIEGIFNRRKSLILKNINNTNLSVLESRVRRRE